MDVNLVASDDPVLKERLPTFDFDAIQALGIENRVNLLKSKMIETKGLGLSANQVGWRERFFVYGNFQEPTTIRVMFNPQIIWESEERTVGEEGCLSFPGWFIKVKRANEIRVRYQDEKGNTQTERFSGLTARVIQHEIDHLNGIIFKKRANKYHLDMAEKQKKTLDALRLGAKYGN